MNKNELKTETLVTKTTLAKEKKERKTIVAKQPSLTAKEREELYSQKVSEQRRAELSEKMTDEQKEEYFKKERQDKFFKRHKSCYLQLFSGFITRKNNAKSQIILETSTFINEWGYILRLFTNKEYINSVEFRNMDTKHTALMYNFNANNMIYENDCESLEKTLKQFSLSIEPMCDIVNNKDNETDNVHNVNNYGFNYEYEKEFDEDNQEIISREDSSNYELNKKITKELIKKSKNDNIVVDLSKKLTGKSQEEIAEAIENDFNQAS